jgi:DnaJ-class molecular chaperone
MKTKQICTRCGGSGNYSFNMMDGTRCYGCSGSGFQMINLAAVAKKQASEAIKAARNEDRRQAHIAKAKRVQEELNRAFGFDLTTELGWHKLNKAVFTTTGKDLAAHYAAAA